MFSEEVDDQETFSLMGPHAFPQSVFIESHRIDACMEYAQRKHSGHIAIAPLEGFKLADLSFLSDFPWIEHLTILDSGLIDISGVSSLRKLRYLQISGKTKQQLNLANFPFLRELRAEWWPKLIFGDILASIRVLSLSHYVSLHGDLKELPQMPELVDLDIVQARDLTLSGIERFPHLRRLRINYLSRLVELSPLTAFADGVLEILEFGNCPKLTGHDQVRVIRSLKRLAFNRCGKIPSLRFLNDLQALESISFVGTEVVDGDLTPCLRLKFVGFLDKTHYSHQNKDFPAAGALWKPTHQVV